MYKLIHRLFGSFGQAKPAGIAKILAPASLAGLAALSIALTAPLASQPASATTSSTVTFNVTDAVSIRLVDKTDTDVITSLDMSLIVTPKGTFVSDWFNAEISTSNATGYTLYMTSDYQSDGSTYTTDLINSDDSTFTIPTLAGDISKTDFSTPGGSYLNRWGYSLDDTTYSPVPAHATSSTLKTTSTEVNKDLVPVYVGVMADMNKASGLYKNSLVFTAIPNPIPTEYSLYFQPGTTDTVTGLPDTMTSSEVAAQHTFTIPSTEPSRAGYSFTGYLDEETGTEYQAGDTITVVGDEEYVGSATLTAQWEQAGCALGANRICYYSNEPSGTVSGTMEDQTIVYMTSSTAANTVDTTTLSGSTTELTLYSPNWTLSGYGFKGWNTAADGSGTMYGPNQTITLTTDQQTQLGSSGLPLYAQWVASAGNMASWSGCSSLAQGSVTALTYGSDTYAVAKLADGKCWMIENLRTSTNAGTATTSMSTSSYTSREYNLTNVSGTAGAYPINLTSPAAASSTSNQYSWKSYGGYYSYASAINTTTAGSTQYSNWNGSSFSTSTTATAQGICPTGWRLPRSYAGSSTNNTESDFRYLNNQLNGSYSSVSTAAASNNWRTYPNNFVFAGFWYSSSSYYRGTYGFYWSSTVYNSSVSYNLYFGSTSVYPAYYGTKNYGFSVRCMLGS